MKKVISYILCVCLIITLFSGAGLFSVSAATYSGTCGDNVTWSYDASTYTLTISGTDEMSNYSHSYNSAGTSAPWSQYYNTIKSLIIEDSVTSIGGYAFRNHTGLTSVTIPDSITSIGNYAFEGCTRLKKVNYIGDIANWCKISFAGPDSNPLYYAHNLYINDELVTDLIIPNSVTSISNYAFCSCTGLTSITIPDSVTEIGGVAFYGCTGLTSITIPDSVTSIGSSAFSGCTGLTSITIPDSITSIGKGAFYNCTGLTSITIPDSITSIGDYAFYNCTGLTSITIPESVTSIGNYAFADCAGLISVVIPDSVISIGDYAFYNCIGLANITIPDSVTSIGYKAFYYCTGLKTAGPIGTGCDYAFGWTKQIPDHAFIGCAGLTSITIPNSITSIGERAFSNCIGLASITLPDLVTSIGDWAFSGCTGLTSITIPDSVTSIGDQAFYNCTGITSIIIPYSVISIGDDVFKGCSSITSITIPGSVTSIGNYAFYGCYGLTNITIPGSVTSIGNCAFYDCYGLTNITIPDSITSIGAGAFHGCSGLTSITIPDSVTEIGEDAFSSCTGLTSVTIPDSITSIGKGAFYNCTGLTSITIPDSITSIGDYAFSGCTRLTSVYYIGEKQQQAQMSIGYHGNDCLLNTNWYYVSLINAKQADCTETGYTGDKVLQETGEIFIYGKEIPALGHDYNTVVTNPTCTAQGYTTHTCSRCNDSYKDDYTYMPCGENCGFIIEDNTLYIYGTGNTDNYKTQTFVPWHDYADSITEIVIDEGITKVGNYAFYCLENVKSIKSKNIDLAFGKYSINDSNTGITVFAENGGTLETYCAENGINYVDPTITPELETVTDNSITVKAVGGYEYSKDGKTWQNSNEFTALSPASEYTIYARYAATADMFDTVGTPLIVTTLKLAVSAPAAPDYQNHTDNSITLIPNDLYEYSIDGENWQKSSEFTGLEKNAIYRFYQRVAETETEYASEPSAALIIAIPDKPQIVRTTTEKITVKRIEGFEYCLDDMVWQNSNVFDKLIDNEEYTIYQRLKAVDGERVYQIVSEPTATLTVNSGAIPGDINGDGSVNNKDLTRLFQYLSDWDVEVNVDALDVNGDGNVNNKDLTRLFQYLSDWDVQIF